MSGRLGDAGENVKSNLRAVAGAREIEDGPTRDRVLDVTVGGRDGRQAKQSRRAFLNSLSMVRWLNGRASDYESGGSRFDPWVDRIFARVLFCRGFPFYIPITPFFHHLSVLPACCSDYHILHYKSLLLPYSHFIWCFGSFHCCSFGPCRVLTPSRS
jgi:hypothetical protein